jgi:outer membrane cobalamin receptor
MGERLRFRLRSGAGTRLPVGGALLCVALGAPAPVGAQFPGGLTGEVLDAATGAPIEAAAVLIADRSALTDASGRFRIQRVLAGRHLLQVVRIGYADASDSVAIHNGQTTHVRVLLAQAPVRLEALDVAARAGELPGSLTIDRTRIQGAAARDAAELLATLPGVVVRSDGAGGRATISLRGGSAGSVLVLLDGARINDPVTGAADLSRIAAERIESITVVPGAQSARFGPGAESGVVSIRSRAARGGSLHAEVGSLGEAALALEHGAGDRRTELSFGGWLRRIDGAFDYRIPAEAGGGSARRANADVTSGGIHVGARHHLRGSRADAAVSYERIERGVPGRSFAPTPSARQGHERVQAGVQWRADRSRSATTLAWSSAADRVAFTDTLPPYGPAIRERSHVVSTSARAEHHVATAGSLRRRHVGLDAQLLRIDASALAARRDDLAAAVFAAAAAALPLPELELDVAVRLDVLSSAGAHATHSATLSWQRGALHAHVAHRSAFTPPSAADQLFREGVGVAPNPHLRPERVPAELEVSVRAATHAAGFALGTGAMLFRGHVRDMVVWRPDFRFVWSPTNQDVRRQGADVWAAVTHEAGVTLRGGYSLAEVTYAHASDPVQLPYRPRHTAQLALEVERTSWSFALRSRFTGVRYPAAARVNALPAFWIHDAQLARDLPLGRWHARAALRVDRLFDERDSLIFGYPEPGRVVRASVTLRPPQPLHP